MNVEKYKKSNGGICKDSNNYKIDYKVYKFYIRDICIASYKKKLNRIIRFVINYIFILNIVFINVKLLFNNI